MVPPGPAKDCQGPAPSTRPIGEKINRKIIKRGKNNLYPGPRTIRQNNGLEFASPRYLTRSSQADKGGSNVFFDRFFFTINSFETIFLFLALYLFIS